jgi:hypothetical protein
MYGVVIVVVVVVVNASVKWERRTSTASTRINTILCGLK